MHKSFKNPLTSGLLWNSNCTLITIGWDFAPDPSDGACSAPHTPQLYFNLLAVWASIVGPSMWRIPLFVFQMLARVWYVQDPNKESEGKIRADYDELYEEMATAFRTLED